jgi:hypothetical protein
MAEYKLSDEQWCLLDLLMRSRQKGVHTLNRTELLRGSMLPQGAALKLTWAALTMPNDLVAWSGDHDFSITEAGVSLYNLRFGMQMPTAVADAVICLPGPDSRIQ